MKELLVKMPERTFNELERLSEKSHRSIGDLVRLGFALVKVAVDETADQNRIVVTTADGKALREVVLSQ